MKTLGEQAEAILDTIRRLVRAVVIVAFAAIVVVVFAQVVSRFVFNAPFSWSEELARYLQVWLILLTSAVCLRKGMHLAVDFAVHGLPSGTKRLLRVVSTGVVVVFLGVVIVSGGTLVAATASQKTSALQAPMWFVYLALPVGAFLMLLEALVLLVREIRGVDRC